MHKLFIGICLISISANLASAQDKSHQSSVILPDNFIQVTIGSNEDSNTQRKTSRQDEEIRRLKGRIYTLEKAVRQLQEEIYWLRYAKEPASSAIPAKDNKASHWFCSITSNFSRTYSGKGSTQVEARSLALTACQERDGISCSEDKIRCEKAE